MSLCLLLDSGLFNLLLKLVDDLLHAFHVTVVLVEESGVSFEPFSLELLLGFFSGKVSDFSPLFLDSLELLLGLRQLVLGKGRRQRSGNRSPGDRSYVIPIAQVQVEIKEKSALDVGTV